MESIITLITNIHKKTKLIWGHITDVIFLIGSVYFAITLLLFSKLTVDPAFFRSGAKINPKLASEYGSFIGGLFNPLVAISSSFFLLMTIFLQIKNHRKSQIEMAVYKLIDYHKENLEKISVLNSNGRLSGNEAIHILNLKFIKIYELVKKHSRITDDKILIDISYCLLFFGFQEGNNTAQSRISGHFKNSDLEKFIKNLRFNTPTISYSGQSFSINISNEYQLGHYFRNLYNTVKIIDIDSTLSKEEKKFYVKILRTQLSTPEIWLMMINSLSSIGQNWRVNDYIRKYELIKNISRDYADIIDPENYYPNIEYEYKEIKNLQFI